MFKIQCKISVLGTPKIERIHSFVYFLHLSYQHLIVTLHIVLGPIYSQVVREHLFMS